jgi:hypothetical protein
MITFTGKMLVTKEYIQGAIIGLYVPEFTENSNNKLHISNADNGFIVVDNGQRPVIITVPAGLMAKMEVGFLQLGTGDASFVATSN